MDPGTFARWLENNGVSWPQVLDEDGFNGEMAKRFHIRSTGIPLVLILDRQGNVVAVNPEREEIVGKVGQLIDERAPADDSGP